jgi:hypothetical protein
LVARTSRANELFEELELELEPDEELEPEELELEPEEEPEPDEERLFFVLRRLLLDFLDVRELEELVDFLGLFAFLDLRTAPSVAIALLVAAIARDIAA